MPLLKKRLVLRSCKYYFIKRLARGISKIASNIKVGPGMDSSTEMGPLVSDEQYQKVSGYNTLGRTVYFGLKKTF